MRSFVMTIAHRRTRECLAAERCDASWPRDGPDADVVNWGDIRDTIVVSLLAGVGLCSAYGLVLLGSVRAREHYEVGDRAQAAMYGLIALAGLAVTLGGIALGLIQIANK